MNLFNNDSGDTTPIMLVTCCVIATIIVIVGGVIVIVHPDTLTFNQYISALSKAVIGLGILGGGRAVKDGINRHAEATQVAATGQALPPMALTPDEESLYGTTADLGADGMSAGDAG